MSSELLKKVKQIEIRTKNLVNDFFGGDYHSNFKGRGMTFSEVREYQHGDDIRFIDWNVTARSESPYIKIFEEERELTAIIAVDVSSSGLFGSNAKLKRDLYIEIAATLGFSAIKNNDKVGLFLFSDKVEKFIPPKKGKSHILRIITELLNFDFETQKRKTSVKNGLNFLGKISKKKNIIFLLSDFMDSNYWDEFKLLNYNHDLIPIQIFDGFEKNIPNLGLIEIEDLENEKSLWIDTSNQKIRIKYASFLKEQSNQFREQCRKIGVKPIQISTDEDFVKSLKLFFKKR
jgi:uncharacterized protein (DUF58 family)